MFVAGDASCVLPDGIQELLPGEHQAWAAAQGLKEVVLQRGELNKRGPDPDLVSRDVDHEITEDAPILIRSPGCGPSAGAGTPQEGVDPGHEGAGREGFGDVVVGADAQTDQHVDLVGAGGQHQHVAAAERAQLAAHLDAVHPGKAQVEDHQVRFGLPGQRQGRFTVACGAHLEAVL